MRTERRFSELSSGEAGKIEGYALKWNVPSFIPQLGRKERFAPGSLHIPKSGAHLNFQHDASRLLANTRSGTLVFSEDDVGLKFRASIPESEKSIRESLRRGDIQGVSVEFHPKQDSIVDGTRVIESGLLTGLSLVAAPSHETELSYRSKEKTKPKRRLWGESLWLYPE